MATVEQLYEHLEKTIRGLSLIHIFSRVRRVVIVTSPEPNFRAASATAMC